MAERFDFDVALQFQSQGATDQMAELGRYVTALDRAIRAQEKFGGSTQNLRQRSEEAARAMQSLSKEFVSNPGELASASKAYENLNTQLREMAAVYRVVQQEAARAETTRFSPAYSGKPANVSAWETQELKEYLDLLNAANANLSTAVREEYNARRDAIEGAVEAKKRYNEAVRADIESNETAGMDRLTASTIRLAQAREELAQAQAQVAREEGESAYATASAAAYDRARNALGQYNAAVRENNAAVEEQAIAARRQTEANEALHAAQEKLDFEKQGADMTSLERAQAKLSDSTEKTAKAQEELAKAQQEYNRAPTEQNDKALLSAKKNLTTATQNQAQAQGALNREMERGTSAAGELNKRYGLYDVARTSALISGAIIGVGTSVTLASAEWERGMASIQQTNMDRSTDQIRDMEESLKDLGGQIPITYAELQELLTLAGQLEVSGDRAAFAEVMAQFGMISDTLDATDAAESIAKLVNVLGGAETVSLSLGLKETEDAYRAVAYAIAEVGVNSAATDAEILHTASNLALVAAQTNMTADEVVGMSAAFASLGIPAERSRSAMQDFVNIVNMGIAGVGSYPEQLQTMAEMMGLTANQAALLWDENPAGFFLQFADSLGQASEKGGDITSILSSMGLEGKRAVPVLAAVSGNTELLAAALNDAGDGAAELDDDMATFQQRMRLVADTTVASWQMFQNEVVRAAQAMGDILLPVVQDVLGWLGEAIIKFREWAETAEGQRWLETAARIAAVVGSIAGVVGIVAAAQASMIALKYSLDLLPFGRVIAQMFGLSAVTRRQSYEAQVASVNNTKNATAIGLKGRAAALTTPLLHGLANALIRVSRAAGWLAVFSIGIGLLTDFRGTVAATSIQFLEWARVGTWVPRQIANAFSWLVGALGNIMAGALRPLETFINVAMSGVEALFDAFGRSVSLPRVDFSSAIAGMRNYSSQLQNADQSFNDTIDNWIANIRIWERANKDLGKAQVPGFEEADTADLTDYFAQLDAWFDALGDDAYNAGEEFGNGLGDGAGKGADKAKKELRLLTDYASDLAGVMSRAFDLRFGSMLSGDAITSSFLDMADAAEESRKRVRDLRQSIRDLRADMMSTAASISQHEYWLSVAVEYGDTLRAEELEAELAKLRAEQAKQTADLADKNKDLADAEDEASLSLTGNSKAAIEQRKTMTDLVKTYQSHLEMLAATGMSQEDLLKESQRLKKEFIDQAVGLGYNRKEVEKYAAAFDDMSLIIATVPRNVDIEFDGDPALTALREFFAKLEDEIDGGIDVPVSAGGLADVERAFDNLFDSIGARMGDLPSFGDAVFGAGGGDISSAGALAGKAVSAEIKKIGATLGKNLRAEGKKAGASYEDEMQKAGQNSGTTFRDVFERIIKTVERILRGEGQKSGASFEGEMRKAGTEGGEGLRRNLHIGLAALTSQMPGVALSAGLAYRGSFEGTATATGTGFGNKVVTGVSTARTKVQSQGTQAGNAYRGALETAGTSTLGSRMGNLAVSALNTARSKIQTAGKNAGNSWAAGVKSSLASGIAASASSAGATAANAFVSGMKARLRGQSLGWILGSNLGGKAGANQNLGNLSMAWYADGGYTGRGGKYDPAGIVHKGEYVVRKELVDQRTGLPKADFMNSLGMPHTGSRASYANGGYVRGGNSGILGGGLTDADRRLIRSIANRPVKVEISSDAVARANNRANSRGSARGV